MSHLEKTATDVITPVALNTPELPLAPLLLTVWEMGALLNSPTGPVYSKG